MSSTMATKIETLKVPGASLYYEVRGSGPVLLMMPGGPADATGFRRIAGRLAAHYTVVTYDPRGLSRSKLDSPLHEERIVEVFADDVHRLLVAVAKEKAHVFASSGGAVIALELAARHPEQLATVVSRAAFADIAARPRPRASGHGRGHPRHTELRDLGRPSRYSAT